MHIAHETAGAARTRSSLRPLLGANDLQNSGKGLSRECGRIPSRRPGLVPGPIQRPWSYLAFPHNRQALWVPAQGRDDEEWLFEN